MTIFIIIIIALFYFWVLCLCKVASKEMPELPRYNKQNIYIIRINILEE